jgi:hypothetical protein
MRYLLILAVIILKQLSIRLKEAEIFFSPSEMILLKKKHPE